MITKFPTDKINMTEDRFWSLVELAKWPCNYDRAKIMYRKMLGSEECSEFRAMADFAFNVLYKKIGKRNPSGGGDDSHSDLIFHIIGLGRKTFYQYLNDYKLIEKLGESNKYKESFSYCIPYDSDYDNGSVYSVPHVITSAKESLAVIEEYRNMDPDWKYLKDIKVNINDLYLIFTDFVKTIETNRDEAISYLISNKSVISKHCKVIKKFFMDNLMELPRKFTDNGQYGFCTARFNNTVEDVELLAEYLK